jgi:hypothetical protein
MHCDLRVVVAIPTGSCGSRGCYTLCLQHFPIYRSQTSVSPASYGTNIRYIAIRLPSPRQQLLLLPRPLHQPLG